jgi:hypothetical protein
MLQAHSLLWHYLWVAPNVLLLILAWVLWRRGSWRQFPAFVTFATLAAAGQLSVYAADIVPSVSAETFWRVDWMSLLIEGLLKFAVLSEVFSRILRAYPVVSRLGRLLIRGLGAVLVFVAAIAAAYGHSDNKFIVLSGAHSLEQTIFIIETGLALFLFLFTHYFQLAWDRASFGILLGLAVSGCVHLATWAAMANGNLSVHVRTLLDFLNMATYHACVLLWIYYILTSEDDVVSPSSGPPSPGPPTPPPDNNLDAWNRELERLLHQRPLQP